MYIHLILFSVSKHGKQCKKHGIKQNRKKCGIYKRHFLYAQLKFVGLKKIDAVKYVYCIKHAYKFLLRQQVGFATVL